MAQPQTKIIGGTPSDTVSYELPSGVFQKIESVLVQVDATGGGDVRPTLRVETQDGVVMAAKRQGETIPAGDTGTATWALRLDDETPSSPAATSDLLYDYTLTAPQTSIDTFSDGPLSGVLPATYAALAWYFVGRTDNAGVGTGGVFQIIVNGDNTASHYGYTDFEWNGAAFGGPTNNTRWNARIPGAAAAANYFNQVKGVFDAYADSVARFRTVQFRGGDFVPTAGFLNVTTGWWKSSAAIDQIAVQTGNPLVNFVAESRLTVVGVGKL